MFPSLFPGAAAEAAAPTWLPEQASAAGDAGQGEVPADNVFGDLLAATIDFAQAAGGSGVEAARGPVVPSPAGLWLTELLAVSQVTGDAESIGATDADSAASLPADETDVPVDLDAADQDATTLAWAAPVSVPVPVPVVVAALVEAQAGQAQGLPLHLTEAKGAGSADQASVAPGVAALRAGTPVAGSGAPALAAEDRSVEDPSVGEAAAHPNSVRPRAAARPVDVQPVAAAPSSEAAGQSDAGAGLVPAQGEAADVEGESVPQPASRNMLATPRASFRFKPDAASSRVAEAANPTQAVAAAPADQVPQNVAADASVSLPKASELGAKTTEVAAFAQRMASAGTVAVNVSNEGGESSADGGARQASNSAARELVANRSGEGSSGAPAAPVFSVASAEPALRPAPAQTASAAQPLATTQEEVENVTRLVESMRVQWRQGIPEATVRLKPEHLGEVTISIKVERGVVSAVVHAETPAVQQWLESQEGKLRSGLADQGLSLERFIVRERQEERREQRQQQQQPPPRYRQPREQGHRFEVTV